MFTLISIKIKRNHRWIHKFNFFYKDLMNGLKSYDNMSSSDDEDLTPE